jgi:zinc transporter 1/2/3
LDNNWKPIAFALFYSLCTPLGVAIGIVLQLFYSEVTPEGLFVQGVLDACSAGVLIYDGLVNMLTPTITRNRQFTNYPLRIQVGTISAVWCGALAMAVIGYWA